MLVNLHCSPNSSPAVHKEGGNTLPRVLDRANESIESCRISNFSALIIKITSRLFREIEESVKKIELMHGNYYVAKVVLVEGQDLDRNWIHPGGSTAMPP